MYIYILFTRVGPYTNTFGRTKHIEFPIYRLLFYRVYGNTPATIVAGVSTITFTVGVVSFTGTHIGYNFA
jgi:hypothetical protein